MTTTTLNLNSSQPVMDKETFWDAFTQGYNECIPDYYASRWELDDHYNELYKEHKTNTLAQIKALGKEQAFTEFSEFKSNWKESFRNEWRRTSGNRSLDENDLEGYFQDMHRYHAPESAVESALNYLNEEYENDCRDDYIRDYLDQIAALWTVKHKKSWLTNTPTRTKLCWDQQALNCWESVWSQRLEFTPEADAQNDWDLSPENDPKSVDYEAPYGS